MEEKNDKFLPIGTVVILKNGKKKLMITGYASVDLKDPKKTVYDYSGCFYPEGVLDQHSILFNSDQIETMFFKGYESDEYKGFIVELKDIISKHNQTNQGS